MTFDRVPVVEQALDDYLAGTADAAQSLEPDVPIREGSGLSARTAIELFEDQVTSRAIDVAGRELKKTDRSFYTISSAGHENNAALGAILRITDPAFLHYRSGALMMARARQLPGMPPTDLASSTRFTGAWVDPAPPAPLPDAVTHFLDAGAPPVVVTFGSMAAPDPAALASAVVSGAHDAGHRVVLQGVPSMLDGDDVMSITTVDHRALFPRAAAVIHHGGAGTTHAAVAAGMLALWR